MKELRYKKKGHIAYITIDRPENANSISRDLADALLSSLDDYESDPELWVAIVSSTGEKFFSAGADLKDEKHADGSAEWERSYFTRLFSVTKPLIAAVNGYCLGAGFGLAMACDLRIASENARFGTPDQKLNTVDCAASVLLSHFIPAAIAMEIIMTGDPIDAQEAYRVGFVNRVVPLEELMKTAEEFAARICANGPLALRACKELNTRARTLALDDAAALFSGIADRVLKSEDTIEGMTAFFEKRKPEWKVR
jgi:enoyl-CoA hydratase/carnithine racemase